MLVIYIYLDEIVSNDFEKRTNYGYVNQMSSMISLVPF